MLARGLGVDARGEVAAAQATSLLLIAVASFGLPEAITYFTARGTRTFVGAPKRVVGLTVAIGGIASVVVLVFSSALAGGDHTAEALIRFAAWSIPPSLALGLWRADAAGRGLWGRIAAERVLSSVVRLIGATFLLGIGEMNPDSATALVAFGPLVGGIAYLRSRPKRDHGAQDPTLRNVASYGGLVWLGAASGILLMRLDQALVTPLAGAAALGLYAVAVAISELPLVVNSAVRDVVFASHSGNFDVDGLTAAARFSFVASGLVALAVAVASPWAIPALFGEAFRGSVIVTWILLAAVAIGTPGSIAGAGLSALGRPGQRSLALAVAAVVNVVAIFVLVPRFGAAGAAWATLIGNLVSSNLNIFLFNLLGSTRSVDFYALRRTDVVAGIGTVRGVLRPHRRRVKDAS